MSSRKYDTTLGVVVRPCAFGAHRMRIAPESSSVVTSAAAELVVPRSTPNDMDGGDDDDDNEAARGRFF